MNVTLILPAHNEETVIGKMVKMTLAVYGSVIRHVIVINDGSTDRTAAIVRQMARTDRRVQLVNRRPPYGVGLAIREGLKHIPADSDYILSLDADFIRNIPDLGDFFKRIKSFDGLIGSRYLIRHSLVRYPLFKKISNRIFHLLVYLVYGVKQKDLTNNFKLYKKRVFESLVLTENGFAINAETGLYPVLLGYNIAELPVTWYAREDDMGMTKFKLIGVAPGYIRVLINASRYSDAPVSKFLRIFLPRTV